MATLKTRSPARRRSRGMSLIEILVGVVIGMLGILVIFQVLAVTEDRKRTTVHGSDAQSAGAIALYQLQRDVQLGGYGFGGAHTKQLGCRVIAYDAVRTGAAGYPKDFDFPLYPVEIVQGAAGAPDTIRALSGSSDQFITSNRSWATSGAMKGITGGRGGFERGDLVILTSDPDSAPVNGKTDCVLVQVTDRTASPSNEIGHDLDYTLNPGEMLPVGVTAPPRFNKDASWPASVFAPTAGFALNLGREPRRLVWAPCNAAAIADNTSPCFNRPEFVNRLVVGETAFGNTTTNKPLYPEPSPAPLYLTAPAPRVSEAGDGIVNLQAEYGIDRNNDQVVGVNEWTETAPLDNADPLDLDNPCGEATPKSWRCVRAIRVALLARSAHWDKTACSPNPQRTSGAGGALALTNFVMANVDGTAPSAAEAACTEDPPSPNNWRRYRYSVYETVIPLRNMIWGTAP